LLYPGQLALNCVDAGAHAGSHTLSFPWMRRDIAVELNLLKRFLQRCRHFQV